MDPVILNTVEVILNGLMAGIMYSLVALGFVLIFKSSGIFNYAQGVMALFAALTLVGLQSGQVPFAHLINAIFGTEVHHFGWELPSILAILGSLAVMVLFAWLVERYILKHLVNQEPIILFMATIGLAYFMEGFGLPPKCREAFLLSRREGWGSSRIAAHLGVSGRMVRLYLARALEHLEAAL